MCLHCEFMAVGLQFIIAILISLSIVLLYNLFLSTVSVGFDLTLIKIE